jgi:hypothetical protein
MGTKASKPAPAPAPKPAPALARATTVPMITTAIQPTATPLTAQQVCQVKQVQLNATRNDLTNIQREVDTCDPRAAQARQTETALADARVWTASKRTELAAARTEFDRQLGVTRSLVAAQAPLQTYLKTLTDESEGLEAQLKKLEHDERKHRRSFLDGDPQSGVPGPLGLETTDDKIMLGFWLTYGIAVFMVSMVLCSMYADRIGDLRQQLITSTIVTVIAFIVAYFPIAKYA